MDSARFAQRTVTKLVTIAEGLGKFPRMGRQVPDNNDSNLREIFHQNYRIAYYIEEQVVILTVHHVAKIEDR